VRAHVIWAPTRLNMSYNFALKPGEVRQCRHYNEQQDGYFY
jgi:hypothetical protein